MNRENQEWMKKILAVLAIVIIGILLFHIVSVASFNQHEYKVQAPMGIGNATRVVAGPLMILHEIYLALLLIWILAILVLSVKRKGTYSKPDFYIYLLLPSGAFLTYIFETVMSADFTMLPVFYVIVDVVLAVRYDRAHLHDISSIIAESHEVHESRGVRCPRP